jgi:hypothetical protein
MDTKIVEDDGKMEKRRNEHKSTKHSFYTHHTFSFSISVSLVMFVPFYSVSFNSLLLLF